VVVVVVVGGVVVVVGGTVVVEAGGAVVGAVGGSDVGVVPTGGMLGVVDVPPAAEFPSVVGVGVGKVVVVPAIGCKAAGFATTTTDHAPHLSLMLPLTWLGPLSRENQ
jgi:hypothetical protein